MLSVRERGWGAAQCGEGSGAGEDKNAMATGVRGSYVVDRGWHVGPNGIWLAHGPVTTLPAASVLQKFPASK
jgi:hypothetical protein